ncbi:MAG: YihY/virulence factor BrkB family protein [Actinomycetes bacterium]
MHPVSRRLIDAAPSRIRPGVELAVRTVDDTVADRVPGLAAEVAFFSLLSLPPLLLTVVATLGLLPGRWAARFTTAVERLATSVLSPESIEEVVRPILAALTADGRTGLAVIAFALTVLSASRAVRVVLVAISIAYDLEETRAGWQQRVWGIGLTLGGIVLVPLVIPLLLAGPDIGEQVLRTLGAPDLAAELWRRLYVPGLGLVLVGLLAVVYHVGAPWSTPWRRDLPGAVLAVVVWFLGSAALRVYSARAIDGREIYDPIAGPLVLLLWLYVTAFAVLLGAELNAEIERQWPREDGPPARRSEPAG